jgi:drug/metabolite transporter (DMT)-like permease
MRLWLLLHVCLFGSVAHGFVVQPVRFSPAVPRTQHDSPRRFVSNIYDAPGVANITDFPPCLAVDWDDEPLLLSSSHPQQLRLIQPILPGLDDVWKARLLLVGAAALYGTNFSLVKVLGETMPVSVSGTLRFGLAAMATLPWLLAPSKASWGAALAGLEVGMWNSIGYVAQAVGLQTTDASKSAFLCSMAVVVVPILDFIMGKIMLPREITGVVMAVLGVGFLELDGTATDLLALNTGDICSLVQPFAFGVGFWRMERGMRLYPQEARRLTAGQLMAVFIASGLYASVVGLPENAQMVEWLTDPQIMCSLFWTSLVTTALTIFMETVALKTLSAAETTLIFSTEPLWGTAFAALVMGEHLGFGTIVGGALILAGCIFSNLGLDGLLGTRAADSVSLVLNTNDALPFVLLDEFSTDSMGDQSFDGIDFVDGIVDKASDVI